MRITSLASRRTAATAAATLSLAAVGIAGIALAPAASATAVALTLSATSGPTSGGNAITATSTANTFLSGTAVEFQYKTASSTTCSTTYSASSSTVFPVSAPKVLTAKKLAVTVPSGVALAAAPSGATSAAFLLCTYTGSTAGTSAVTGTAAYSVAAAPTVTSVSPTTGPSLGGGTITLTGTNFTATTTATIGTVALTGITFIDSTHISGTVPAQAAGALLVNASSIGGSSGSSVSYTYSNGIQISPNTTPTATATTDVDIQGVGFDALDFATTTGSLPDDATASVYVVDGDYNPLSASGSKTKGELGECLNVLPISDTELICTVNTADSDGAGSGSSAIANGTYTIAVVNDGTVGAQLVTGYSKSIVSSGSTFTVAPY